MERTKKTKIAISVMISVLVFALMMFFGLTASVSKGGHVADADGGHTHNDITFTAWNSNNSLPSTAGSYYLTADVTIGSTWSVPAGTTNLCLNGHVIAAASDEFISVITIGNGSTLNLYDCDTTTHYYYVDANTYKENRYWERNKMYDIGEIAADGPSNSAYSNSAKKGTFVGGYITGGTGQGLTTNGDNISGGGFQIYGGGTLNMYGGCIFGNYTSATSDKGNEGGGVYIYENGVFNMNGGYIIGNQGGNSAGGVENCGTFTMNGGYIGHNTAGDGGWANGGGVSNTNTGTMTMNGGVIDGNEAGGFGGLLGKCGGGINNEGSLTINGGSIINNFCDNVGGAIYNNGSLTIGADAKITGNYNDETKKADNVYLQTDKKITIGSALTEGNSVGVTMKSGTGVFTDGWSDYMGDADPADYFFSDDEKYSVYMKDSEAAILAKPPVTLGEGKLFVGGEDIVKAENYTVSGEGGGTAVLSEKDGNPVLTLTNFKYEGSGYNKYGEGGGIDYRGSGNLTIILNGESSIVKKNDNSIDRSHGIYFSSSGGSLIIDGTGSLTISFDSGRSGWKSNGIFCEPGAFVMNGGTVVSNAGRGNESAGIYTDDGITFNGGSFTGNGYYTTAYESRGIYSGTITVNGGTVYASAPRDNQYQAYAFHTSSLTINNGEVTAYGKTALSSSWGVGFGPQTTYSILAGEDPDSATAVESVSESDYKYVHVSAQEQSDPVARVGEVQYGSLLEAYEASSENDVIVLLADIDISNKSNHILIKRSVTLDISGHILNVGTQSAVKVGGSETGTPVVLTVTNSAPETGGVLGICGVAGDGSYLLFYDARLGFTKAQLAATSDINKIATDYEIVTIEQTEAAYGEGFRSLIRPAQFKWTIKITAKSAVPSDYAAYVDDGEKVVRVYGVTLYRIALSGDDANVPVSVQPSDINNNFTLTVKLTVPSALIGKNFRVLHVHAADDYAFVDFTMDEDGKHIRISGVDRLSDFAFVALESDLIPSGQGGEQGQPEEQEQGQGEVPTIEREPEITKEDDPTIDNWELTPQDSTEPGGEGDPSSEVPKPAVTVALEDTEPQSDVSVEIEFKTEISEEVKEIQDSVLNTVIQSDDEIAVVYDVKLIRTTIENGIEIREEIQPSDIKPGTVVVINMLIPESLRGKSFRMLHIHSDNDIKEISYTVSEDGTTATVRVDRLSEFAFIGKTANSGDEIIEPNKLSDGAIIGIVIGGSLGVLLLGLLIFFLLKRKKKEKDLDDNEAVSAAPIPAASAAGAFAVSEQPALQVVKGEMAVADADEAADDGIVVYAKGNYFNIRYIKSFTAKLIQSSDETKGYYGELKNEVLSYTKAKSHVSWAYDSVNAGREHIVKFGVRGKTLCVYFPLNVEDLDEKYKVEKVDAAKYAAVPCLYRIKNERRLRYAKELIEKVCLSIGLIKGETKSEDYYLPYETNEPLIARGLIKELTVKATDTQIERAKKEGSIRVVDKVSASDVNAMISHEVALAAIIKTEQHTHATGKKGIINVDTLSLNFNDGDTVTVQSLKEKKLIAHDVKQVKLLARGNLDKVLHVELQDYSIEAVKMIIATGGTVKRC